MNNTALTVSFVAIALCVGFFIGKAFEKDSSQKTPLEQVTTQKIEARPEQFLISDNIYANATIQKLQNNGWKIKSVKPITAPSGLGLYDVLITYE